MSQIQYTVSVGKDLTMAPSGRKHGGKAGKPAQEDETIPSFDFEEERKELSGSEEDIREGALYEIFRTFVKCEFYHICDYEKKGRTSESARD